MKRIVMITDKWVKTALVCAGGGAGVSAAIGYSAVLGAIIGVLIGVWATSTLPNGRP